MPRVGAIAKNLPAYYVKTYPDAYKAKKAQIDGAVASLQQIFQTTRFP